MMREFADASCLSMIKPKNLNQALSLLLFFVTVPLLMGALALLVSQARNERQLRQTQLMALARTLAQAVDRELDYGKAQMQVLAASSPIDREDWRELHAFGREITRDRPGSLIGLIGPDGTPVMNTSVPWGKPLPNIWNLARQPDVEWEGRKLPLSSKELTRQVFEKNQAIYSDLYYGLFIKRPTLALAVPVVRNGRVAYALLLAFPPVQIDQLIRESVNAPGIRATVIDRQWRVVASNAAATSRLGETAVPMPIPAGSMSGTYEATARDGTRLQGTYAVSPANGFVVRVALPADSLVSHGLGLSSGWLLLVVGVLLFSTLLAGSLGGRLARALRELGEAARDGLAPRGKPTGIAEIDLLAQALRTGVQAEDRRREELVANTRRKQTELELRKADRQKDEFLATLAHELRNPLAPIRSAVELIRQRQPADAVVLRARNVIERQVSHLSRLVDDLLEVSRITMGTIHLRHEMLDLGALVAGVAEAAEASVRTASLHLTLDPGNAPVMVSGDAIRLSQCVTNLVNNAIKFTPPDGRITLRVLKENHLAVVEVGDNGIGIAAENLERIFDLFVQANPSGIHGHTGLGIGLALTRKLVALHGGAVHADSTGNGQGSRFRIELPLTASQTAEATTAGQARDARAIDSARVLVVDDNCDAADMLGEMLALCDFHTSVAYTGGAALRAVASTPVDAVLLDIGLPDLDGYQVCRRIRAMSGLHQPVLIAVTGWGQESDRAQAFAAGFDAHLTKPTDPDEVLAVLREKIAARKAAATG
ncbi:MAG: chemotaxis protein methyltransferase CheR [Polaromonas sp.]|nr:chemotaxis protein methyltransferase CheR [Polaromonas sp.]